MSGEQLIAIGHTHTGADPEFSRGGGGRLEFSLPPTKNTQFSVNKRGASTTQADGE